MSTQDNIPQIQLIPIESIEPSPMNPRKSFSEDALRELSESISEQGLLQPITVRPSDYDDYVENDQVISYPIKYEIVCGERRYRACKMVDMVVIPCIVREMTDDEAFDAMITENLQRNDVDPIDEAVAFNLLAERGIKPADIAARFGKSLSYVRDRMRLSQLIEPLRQAISTEQLPLRGAYLLARLSTEDQNNFVDHEYDGNELIPGSYCSPTYEQMQDFLKMHANDNSWKRRAIVEYMESAQSKPSMFSGLVSHLHIEVEDFANRTRQEAEARIESINDELRELGYDEKGNKL